MYSRDELREIAEQAVENAGFETIAIRFPRSRTLEVTIDREPDGVDISACTKVSHILKEAFELEGLGTGSYNFQVQSPGLDRLLTRQKDFERFKGETVRVRLLRKVEGRSRHVGKLLGRNESDVIIETDGFEVHLPRDNIKEVRLVPQIPNF